MYPARLWKSLKEGRLQCRLCSHFCVIEPGGAGKCGVRVNQSGELRTLVYDRIAAMNVDPVEKKPLYHFFPGHRTFSFGTMGCNLGCSFCQNYSLSQPPRDGLPIKGQAANPVELAANAQELGCLSISYTYSEPTIFFELMQDTALAAKQRGLKNIMVSNGFMTIDCLEELAPLIDAANIDLKAFTPRFYELVCAAGLEPVKKNLVHMRGLGWWIEVTTLIIPGFNDTKDELTALASFIVNELGADTPWHLSRFRPDHKLRDVPPTSAAALEKAWAIGREAGLNYVYVGNLPGNAHNSTICPVCGRTLTQRDGFTVSSLSPADGKCPSCNTRIAGRF